MDITQEATGEEITDLMDEEALVVVTQEDLKVLVDRETQTSQKFGAYSLSPTEREDYRLFLGNCNHHPTTLKKGQSH